MSKIKLIFTLLLLMSNVIIARNARYQSQRYAQPSYSTSQPQNYEQYEDQTAQEGYSDDTNEDYQPTSGIRVLKNKSEVDAALNSTRPTIIYCSAPWCTACTQMMEPVVNQAASKHGGSIDFCKLDYDKFKSYASQLGIQGLPHTIFRQGGKTITMSGSRPAGYFMNQVEAFRQGRMQPEQTSTKTTSSSSSKRKSAK